MVLTTSVGTALAIASSVELRHRKLVDDFIPFMSESSRRGRCRHRYATRLRSSTEFDGIVPVEYRGESQVLRFSCQRRALLTDRYTAATASKPTSSCVTEVWMRRVIYATSAALITLGTTGSLADRSLALPLSEPRVNIVAIAGSPVQRAAYICRRWWQWRGARWVRTCWPAGYDPCWNAPGCSPPTPQYPFWRPWGWPYSDWLFY